LVNGLGATHPLELQLLFGELHAYLGGRGIRVERSLVGSFVTALDMAGASITLIRCDDELLELWDAPTTAPAWPNALARGPHEAGESAHGGAGAGEAAPGDGAATGDEAEAGDAAEADDAARPDEPAEAADRMGRRRVAAWLGSWIDRV